jgi:hypothetical protein
MGHETPISNPPTGNLAAIRDGLSLFRVNCALCHGLDAKRAIRGCCLTLGRVIGLNGGCFVGG